MRLVSGALRVVAVAVVMFLAISYLKLGYFALFMLPLGALAAVLLTRALRAGYSRVWSSLAAIVAFGAAYALVGLVAIRNLDETRDLTWEVLDRPTQTTPEVRLYLGGGDFLFSYSSELASYLRSRSNQTVAVSLPVTRVLGCFEGIGPPRIEGWGVMPLGGYGTGSTGSSPWEKHWWCP